MFDTIFDLLRWLTTSNVYACPPDDDDEEENNDGDDGDDDDDNEENNDNDDDGDDGGNEENNNDNNDDDEENDDDQEDDEDEELATPAPKTYDEKYVKRLRSESKSRRQKSKTDADTIKTLKQQLKEAQSGRAAKVKEKSQKAKADSQLEEQVENLTNQLTDITDQRDALVSLQTQTDMVLTVGKIAQEVGFRDAGDAIAFISPKLDDFTDADGDIDEDALQSELEELLEAKDYLSADYVKDERVKKQKAKKVASKVNNPPADQNTEAPQGKKGKSRSEANVNKRIREALNKQHDGKAALHIWVQEKYLPQTNKENVTVS